MVTINPEINMGVRRVSLPVWSVVQPITVGPILTAGLPELLRRQTLCADRHRLFCLVLAAIFGYVWPPVQHATMQAASGSFLRARWVPVSLVHQPSADPNRSASGTEHHRLVQIGEFTNAAGTVFHGDINRSMPVTAPRGCSCPASSRS